MPLSERMERNLSLMLPCTCAADIGCDHGFVSIELVKRGICERMIAMDVRTGPLERAKAHIREAGLEGRIETRLSDGFAGVSPGEIRGALIAGMGGALMQKILTQGWNVVSGLDYLVLQPQSEIEQFRIFLRENHLAQDRTEIVSEDGKGYVSIRVFPAVDPMLRPLSGGTTYAERLSRLEKKLGTNAKYVPLLADRYGADLLLEDRGLREYLQIEEVRIEKVILQLLSQDRVRDEKVEEFAEKRNMNRLAQHVLEVADGI